MTVVDVLLNVLDFFVNILNQFFRKLCAIRCQKDIINVPIWRVPSEAGTRKGAKSFHFFRDDKTRLMHGDL
jgi:hypothetical protein